MQSEALQYTLMITRDPKLLRTVSSWERDMNRPLTTVEFLQQRLSLQPQITAPSLKRPIESYQSDNIYTTTTVEYSLQDISRNTYPRKRQNFGSREAVFTENWENFQPRSKSHSRTPSKPSRISTHNNDIDSLTKGHELHQLITKCSLVLLSF